MSYCRTGPESDVHVYPMENAKGKTWIVCHECSLGNGKSQMYKKSIDMLEHLLEHRRRGDKVPESVLDRLEEEAKYGMW